MGISKKQKLKLGIIKLWPLHNKFRIASKLLPMVSKNGSPLFKGISFLRENHLLNTHTGNYLDYMVFATGSYEPAIAGLITSQINPGSTVMDIGANVGIHTITMGKAAGPNGKVYAFEPIGFLRKKIEENIWLNNLHNVEIIPSALSNQAGKQEIFFDENDSNLGTASLGKKSEQTNLEIDIKVGDEVAQELGISQLDLMKIDVEGFELKVLKGLESTISKLRPRIIFEFDVNYIKRVEEEGMDVKEEIFSYFSSKNYQLFEIANHGLINIDSAEGFPWSSNVFALPLKQS